MGYLPHFKIFISKIMRIFFLFLVIIIYCQSALALSPEAHLPDEKLEQRAMNLFREIRCVSCSGQLIESSNSVFSVQMRRLVREKIAANESDEQIRSELRQEFGDDILISVAANGYGVWLWVLPIIFAVGLLIPLRLRRGGLR